MQAKAMARTVRIAPRKVRMVLDLVRGKEVSEALAILKLTNKRTSPVVEKLIKSAVANAEHNYDMDIERLVVSEIYANEGPTLKRFRPRALGRASRINKRTSHITVVLEEFVFEDENETVKAPVQEDELESTETVETTEETTETVETTETAENVEVEETVENVEEQEVETTSEENTEEKTEKA